MFTLHATVASELATTPPPIALLTAVAASITVAVLTAAIRKRRDEISFYFAPLAPRPQAY